LQFWKFSPYIGHGWVYIRAWNMSYESHVL
jgi:hypothetical protein